MTPMPIASTLLALLAMKTEITPPAMSIREIGPEVPVTGGTMTGVVVGDTKAELFVPDGYRPGLSTHIWIHFHTAAWFVVSEYQRAGFKVPILVFNLGQGSSTYAKPFVANGSLQPFLSDAGHILGAGIDRVNITSFSAGYGAVRELIHDPAILSMIGKVVQSDSIYGSLDPGEPGSRRVLAEHVRAWKSLTDRALAGTSTVVMTTSQITPETYAGSWEVVSALVASYGMQMEPAQPGYDAAADPRYPLLRVFDKAGWHVWSYAGDDAMAHMTHPRHLAEILRQLGPG
ncbi:MAG: hypothetical protein JNM28_08015 [Armatimonadetes bacterium]|nr:hypothetical protein [Armatimonadota bacterium]